MFASTKFVDEPHKNYHEFVDPVTQGHSSIVIRISVFNQKPTFMTAIDLFSEMDEEVVCFYCYEGFKDKKGVVVDFSKFVTMFVTDCDLMSF